MPVVVRVVRRRGFLHGQNAARTPGAPFRETRPSKPVLLAPLRRAEQRRACADDVRASSGDVDADALPDAYAYAYADAYAPCANAILDAIPDASASGQCRHLRDRHPRDSRAPAAP